MPDAAVLLFLIVVSVPAGFILSLIAVFGGLPLYYRLRGMRPGARKAGLSLKLLYTLAGTMIFAGGFCAFEVYRAVSLQNDFWQHRGAAGYWRIPLEEPYELGMRGSMNSGYIGRWQHEGAVIENVIAFEKRGPLVAGQLSAPGKSAEEWCIFDCTDGKVRTFSSIGDFYDACSRTGFVLPVALEAVRHRWYVYWGLVEAAR
jgi:hypothetical protein